MTDPAPAPVEQRLPRLWPTALLAVLVLAMALAADVARAGLALRRGRLLDVLERDPAAFTDAELAAAEGPVVVIVVAFLGLSLLSFVCLGLFLRAAWLTAQALGVRGLRYGPTWALFGWFVPIMGLFVPKRIADDVWRATGDASTATYWTTSARPPLVTVWWAVLLVSLVSPNGFAADAPPLIAVALLVEIALVLLSTAVVVTLALRLSRRAAAQQRPLLLPAPLRRPEPGLPAWAPAVLTVAAGAVLVLSLGVAAREAGRLPADLRAQEAAALALPATGATPGLSLSPRPQALPVPEPTERRATVDPTGPYEQVLLEPPGLERVADDPDYAGSYDLDRLVAAVPEGEQAAAREALTSFGFVQGQLAAFDSAHQRLEVTVFEFGTEADAAEWVTAGAQTAGAFDVDTPGGRGHRSTLEDDVVLDTTAVAVGRLALQLDLYSPARFSTNEAVVLLRLQQQAAEAAGAGS